MKTDSGLHQWIPEDRRTRNRICNELHALLYRGMYWRGLSTYKIAELFGMKQGTVQQIVMGDLYRGVPASKFGIAYQPGWNNIDALQRDWLEYKRVHQPPQIEKEDLELREAKRRFGKVKKFLSKRRQTAAG